MFYKIKDFFKEIKYAFQRIKKGYCDRDLFSIDHRFLNIMPKMLEEFSKDTLKLPSKIASTEIFGNIKTKLRDPAWYTVLGLIIPTTDNDSYPGGTFQDMLKNLKRVIKSNIKQLMP